MPAQHDRVEATAVFAKPRRCARGERRMPAFDAKLLERVRGGAVIRAIGRQEDDVRAFFAQQAHEVHQAQRTRIVIRMRRQK